MDGILEDRLDEEVRVWPVDSLDRYGDSLAAVAVVVPCRIERGVTIVTEGVGTGSQTADQIISHVEIAQDARVALPGDTGEGAEARTVMRTRRRPAGLDGSPAAFETYV